VVKNFFFEIGHSGYKKIEDFMLISKMQTYFSDKMPHPLKKNLNLKKNKNIILILTFWWTFCHQNKFAF
jgi:hypothetical protein